MSVLDHLLTPAEQRRLLHAMEKTPSGRSAGAPGTSADYPHIDFSPPLAVREAALEALNLRAAGHRGGTDIGMGRAVQLVTASTIPPRDIRRMVNYFSRHERDLDAVHRGARTPTPGQVAWGLWGGWPGKWWADAILKQMQGSRRRRR